MKIIYLIYGKTVLRNYQSVIILYYGFFVRPEIWIIKKNFRLKIKHLMHYGLMNYSLMNYCIIKDFLWYDSYSVMLNVVLLPSTDVTLIVPSCSFTTLWAKESPSPVPLP